jgi:hypothetical protein
MKTPRFFVPLLVSLVVTPPFLWVAIASVGGGHGHYLGAKILFPFALLSARILGSAFASLILLALVQFPLYGLMLGKANVKRQFLPCLATLLAIHTLATAACFIFSGENFS